MDEQCQTDGDGAIDDCDPWRADVGRYAPETCNDRDDDCDGEIDEHCAEPPDTCGCAVGGASALAAPVVALLAIRRRRDAAPTR